MTTVSEWFAFNYRNEVIRLALKDIIQENTSKLNLEIWWAKHCSLLNMAFFNLSGIMLRLFFLGFFFQNFSFIIGRTMLILKMWRLRKLLLVHEMIREWECIVLLNGEPLVLVASEHDRCGLVIVHVLDLTFYKVLSRSVRNHVPKFRMIMLQIIYQIWLAWA